MKIDNLGIPVYSYSDVLDILYQGNLHYLDKILVDIPDQTVFEFNNSVSEISNIKLQKYQPIDICIEDFDRASQENWLMPDEYKNMDIEGYLVHVCPKENYQRLIEELQEFRSRNMINLLKWLKYFVDTCRKNNVVWGVGRGSSVSSYVLYLIGVHKINSIKYKLDWRDFLR